MDFAETLIAIEHEQWQALKSVPDAIAFYSEYLTEDSLMTVPYGIGDRAQIISSMEISPVILNYEMRDPQVIQLGTDSGILVYNMTQVRQGVDPFEAAISTAYTRRNGEWRIVYHQQTPLLTEEERSL